jgi:peptide alpha-N-acetyltransferase
MSEAAAVTADASSSAAEILSTLKVSSDTADKNKDISIPGIRFQDYQDERQLFSVMRLVSKDLSEPYSIFTYRYFLMRFPELCILAVPEEGGEPVGCVVCKIDTSDGDGVTDIPMQPLEDGAENQEQALSGYMGMLAVETDRRGSGIGTALATLAIRRMRDMGCTSVTLETEVTNDAAIRLYEDRLGFVREELLVRYYLNWGDAYRLRLWFD